MSHPPPLPPLLPLDTLGRVLRLARFDGAAALVLGTLFALLAAAGRQGPFAVIGLLAAGAGAIELHGAALLRAGDPRGMKWLVASQPFLFLVILSYCAVRLWLIEIPELPDTVRALLATSAAQWGLTLEEYLQRINRLTSLVLAVVALGFQGGMTLYYLRRRAAVELALTDSDDDPDPSLG